MNGTTRLDSGIDVTDLKTGLSGMTEGCGKDKWAEMMWRYLTLKDGSRMGWMSTKFQLAPSIGERHWGFMTCYLTCVISSWATLGNFSNARMWSHASIKPKDVDRNKWISGARREDSFLPYHMSGQDSEAEELRVIGVEPGSAEKSGFSILGAWEHKVSRLCKWPFRTKGPTL